MVTHRWSAFLLLWFDSFSDHFCRAASLTCAVRLLQGCRRSAGLLSALGMGSSDHQSFWGGSPRKRFPCWSPTKCASSSLTFLPPLVAESCFLPEPSGCSISSQLPESRFLERVVAAVAQDREETITWRLYWNTCLDQLRAGSADLMLDSN